MATEQKKAPPDWERIESEYRAGIRSVREIAAIYGVSHTAIQKKAKVEGWERDLAAKVKAKAEALVAKREVAKLVANESKVTERQLIDAGALAIANIRMEHRSDIRRGRTLVMTLLTEAEGQTGAIELIEGLGELMRSESDSGLDKMNDLYRKIIALPSRVDTVKKLAESLKHLIGLEREAYGLAEVQKLEVTGKDGNPLITSNKYEFTDEQLAVIAAGGGAATS